jgi:hypothetical protein
MKNIFALLILSLAFTASARDKVKSLSSENGSLLVSTTGAASPFQAIDFSRSGTLALTGIASGTATEWSTVYLPKGNWLITGQLTLSHGTMTSANDAHLRWWINTSLTENIRDRTVCPFQDAYVNGSRTGCEGTFLVESKGEEYTLGFAVVYSSVGTGTFNASESKFMAIRLH